MKNQPINFPVAGLIAVRYKLLCKKSGFYVAGHAGEYEWWSVENCKNYFKYNKNLKMKDYEIHRIYKAEIYSIPEKVSYKEK